MNLLLLSVVKEGVEGDGCCFKVLTVKALFSVCLLYFVRLFCTNWLAETSIFWLLVCRGSCLPGLLNRSSSLVVGQHFLGGNLLLYCYVLQLF